MCQCSKKQEITELYQTIKQTLKEGDKFKSFPKLLEALNISQSYAKGSLRIRTMAKLSCCMEMEQAESSYEITIKKIYRQEEIKTYVCPTSKSIYKKKSNDPTLQSDIYNDALKKLKEDKRFKFLYANIMLLSDYAAREKKTNFCISNSELLFELGFVNDNYKRLSNLLNQSIDTLEPKDLRHFKEQYSFKSIINGTCIKNIIIGKDKCGTLRKYGFFDYEEEYLVKNMSGLVRFADKTEKNFIKQKISEIGYDTSIFTTKKHREKLNFELMKKFRLTYAGKTNHFIFNENYVPIIITDEERMRLRKSNNVNATSRIKKRISDTLPKIYEYYESCKEKYGVKYEYPFDCGNIKKCEKIMNEYIEKYIFI